MFFAFIQQTSCDEFVASAHALDVVSTFAMLVLDYFGHDTYSAVTSAGVMFTSTGRYHQFHNVSLNFSVVQLRMYPCFWCRQCLVFQQ